MDPVWGRVSGPVAHGCRFKRNWQSRVLVLASFSKVGVLYVMLLRGLHHPKRGAVQKPRDQIGP